MGTEEIAYQNKDITSKFLAEHLKGKSFRVYGLDLPEIKEVKPTNIPVVQAKELRMDSLFELEDGTVAIVDYESDYEEEDKIKYLGYLIGVARRYRENREPCQKLRMVVIYTGDIKRQTVSCQYDIGALQMEIEAAFLSELDSEGILPELREKVARKELLSDEELMKFIILPLSYRKKEEKEQRLKEVVGLVTQIQNREQQVFALSGLLVFADKIMDRETAKRIRRAIEMTQVAMIFEEEKQEALREAAKRFEKEKQEAIERQAEQLTEQMVVRMLKRGDTPEEIASVVPNYSQNDVEAVRAKLEKKP